MTEVVRQVGQFQLIKDVSGNHRVVNTQLMNDKNEDGLSYWLEPDSVELLKRVDRNEFISRAKQYAGG